MNERTLVYVAIAAAAVWWFFIRKPSASAQQNAWAGALAATSPVSPGVAAAYGAQQGFMEGVTGTTFGSAEPVDASPTGSAPTVPEDAGPLAAFQAGASTGGTRTITGRTGGIRRKDE